jgi:hyperosmotically inducible protein
MIRGLLKLLLIVLIVVAAASFFFGYRWGAPDTTADVDVHRPAPAVGTTGTAADERQRAREVGAEIGEKVAAGANSAERALANGQLTAKIKSKMALDDTVSAAAIDIDSNNGVVTLSGTVGSAAEKQRALQLARETEGVSSVVDRLMIR